MVMMTGGGVIEGIGGEREMVRLKREILYTLRG
jgi:hypothetical protein